jgi:hypothetical protein
MNSIVTPRNTSSDVSRAVATFDSALGGAGAEIVVVSAVSVFATVCVIRAICGYWRARSSYGRKCHSKKVHVRFHESR